MHAFRTLTHAVLAAFETEDGRGDMAGFLANIDISGTTL